MTMYLQREREKIDNKVCGGKMEATTAWSDDAMRYRKLFFFLSYHAV